MSLDRVSVVTPTSPVGIADYQAIIAQLEARIDAFTGREIIDGSTIRVGTVIAIGGVAYKATTDTAISGVASNYVKITPSGATASAAFVADLTGVTWSHAYGGYYDGGALVVFDESLAKRSGVIATAHTLLGREGANWKDGDSPANVLASLLTVDGPTSGINSQYFSDLSPGSFYRLSDDGATTRNLGSVDFNGIVTPGIFRASGGLSNNDPLGLVYQYAVEVFKNDSNIVAQKVTTLNYSSVLTWTRQTSNGGSTWTGWVGVQTTLSAADILSLLLTVDGPTSGINSQYFSDLSPGSFYRLSDDGTTTRNLGSVNFNTVVSPGIFKAAGGASNNDPLLSVYQYALEVFKNDSNIIAQRATTLNYTSPKTWVRQTADGGSSWISWVIQDADTLDGYHASDFDIAHTFSFVGYNSAASHVMASMALNETRYVELGVGSNALTIALPSSPSNRIYIVKKMSGTGGTTTDGVLKTSDQIYSKGAVPSNEVIYVFRAI